MTSETTPEAATGAAVAPCEASEADATPVGTKSARDRIADRLWWSIPSTDDADAKAQAAAWLDEYAAAVRAAALREGADAVLRSSHGEPMRDAHNAQMRDAGLLRRLASRAPEQPMMPAETATEYGIRIPGGRIILDGSTRNRAEQVERLARCRGKAMWPDAVLVQRAVSYGEWAEVTA